jgi:glutamate formiminotransferase / 5-formyltetrahydrofolate cyclo-ligase
VIESVPNISEGRRLDVVATLADAVRETARLLLLDHSADPSHNRSVLTLAGDGEAVLEGLLRVFEIAIDRIDLRHHRGVHPRIGAVDVVPFIPLQGSTMDECIVLSRRFGATVADRFEVPVFLYEQSAVRPERRRLEEIRRGQFEGLAARMQHPDWTPDFGPRSPHPAAGATVVGARMPLVAFNVNLASTDLEAARSIAAAVRERDGGLACV